MAKMLGAEPQFVRCVKPNSRSQNDVFEDKLVQRQLQYTGVLETIKIRRMGFPSRLVFADFIRRYFLPPIQTHIYFHTSRKQYKAITTIYKEEANKQCYFTRENNILI